MKKGNIKKFKITMSYCVKSYGKNKIRELESGRDLMLFYLYIGYGPITKENCEHRLERLKKKCKEKK